jgi:hypothetical protein
VYDFAIAPDEVHLAVFTNPGRRCTMNSHRDAPLTTLLAVSACGQPTAIPLATEVDVYDGTRFTPDGRHLVYVRNVLDPCSWVGDIWVADADGGGPHMLAAGVDWGGSLGVSNTGVTYGTGFEHQNGIAHSVSFAGGAPIDVPYDLGPTTTGWFRSPSGRIAGKVTGTEADIVGPDGQVLWALSTHLDQPYWDEKFWFSDDESEVLFVERNDDMTRQLVFHSTGDAGLVIVPGFPQDTTMWASDALIAHDNSFVAVELANESNEFPDRTWYGAATLGQEALAVLFTAPVGANSVVLAPSNDFLAYWPSGYHSSPDATVTIVPLAGGPSVSVSGWTALYEPVAASPRLAVIGPVPGTWHAQLRLWPTGGTGTPVSVTVADSIDYPLWLGRRLVYETTSYDTDGTTFTIDVRMVASDNSKERVLGAGVGSHRWAPITTPTRLYYTQRVYNSQTPVDPAAVSSGLWVTAF